MKESSSAPPVSMTKNISGTRSLICRCRQHNWSILRAIKIIDLPCLMLCYRASRIFWFHSQNVGGKHTHLFYLKCSS